MTPDVTVIIAAYNAMPYVTRSVTSVLEQSLAPERIEIIAVDDGSTDGTGEELDRLASMTSNMIVVHQENSGTPAAPRNLALDRATGRYVFFHDADDYLGTEALERMVTAADANGTDVVLGRIVGVGGRPAPRSMFTSTQPKTDVSASRAWWTLSPQKLFRRELVERLSLRFNPRFPQGGDMTFVGAAYLAASAISILADYDYVYLTWRDDGRNITLTRTGLPERMAIAAAMFELVDERVAAGEERDRLMQRHFAVEVVDTVVPPLVTEVSEERRMHAARTISTWAEKWFTPGVEHASRPLVREYLHLISAGRLDAVVDLNAWIAEGGVPDVVLDDGRAYLAYPGFRDPALVLPDSLFDVSGRLKIVHELSCVTFDGSRLTVSLNAGFALAGGIPAAHLPADAGLLVLRERVTGAEYPLLLEPDGTDGFGPWRVAVDLGAVGSGQSLGRGRWDAFVSLHAGEVSREARLGRCRTSEFAGLPDPRYGFGPERDATVTPYFTDPHGNLTLAIGPVKQTSPQVLQIEAVAWHGTRHPVIRVTGVWRMSGVPPSAVRFALSSVDGTVHVVHAEPSPLAADVCAFDLDLMTAVAGKPLESGEWRLDLRVRASGLKQDVHMSALEPGHATLRKGLRRTAATLRTGSEGQVLVTVGRKR
ncbi:MAG: glycosyltransferase family 2 protein [Coriobacteriia bacterium]|nr:glycosyltransferase family 2 protein [Coriobacteriia bacterium]